jgi:hypothetical protein
VSKVVSVRHKQIVKALRNGAVLWHSYRRSQSNCAYLVYNDKVECVRFKTLDAMVESGLIEEIEDDNPDVTYRAKES